MMIQEYGLIYTLGFGKYKGYTVEEVIKDDPDYLAWAVDNIDWFELDAEAAQRLDEVLYYDDNDYAWHDAFDSHWGK